MYLIIKLEENGQVVVYKDLSDKCIQNAKKMDLTVYLL